MKRILNTGNTARYFLGVLLLLGVFYFGGSARSQDIYQSTTGVQISPVRFDWDMNSGDERTGTINLKNYSDKTYEVEVGVEDFYVSDDSSEAQFFIPNQGHPLYAYDVINWITAPGIQTLAPGEGRDVIFKVKVPKETPTGGYYGAIFFKNNVSAAEQKPTEGSQLVVNQRVGALLVMAVKGDQPIKRSAKLNAFSSIKKVFWNNPAELSTQILNDGNLHFKGAGKVEIRKFGSLKETFNLDPRVMYPGKIRNYQTQWTFSPWGYGWYQADLSFASEDGGITLSGTTSFWVIPWKTTVAVVILLLILWIIWNVFSKKFEIRRKE
jgi:hypothetical protein